MYNIHHWPGRVLGSESGDDPDIDHELTEVLFASSSHEETSICLSRIQFIPSTTTIEHFEQNQPLTLSVGMGQGEAAYAYFSTSFCYIFHCPSHT